MNTDLNILAIFGNVDTSNASSIQINSLLKYISENIKIKFYKLVDDYQLNIKSIKDYDKFFNKAKIIDKRKKEIKKNEIKYIKDVEEQLKEKKYDIIFGWSNPYLSSTIAIALGIKHNLPVILRIGDFYKYEKNKLNEYLFAKTLIVPNEILREKMIKFYGNKLNENKIKVIPQHFETYEVKNIIYLKKNYINFLHTGNLYQERKIDKFMSIINYIDESLKNKIKFEFIGCHDKLNDDINLCKKYNLNADFSNCYQFENWNFQKAIPYYEMRKYFNTSDILLHIEFISDNNHFLSFKLIDYLAYNKPIITITQKNSPNYFLAKECGFAFGDIDDNKQLLEVFQDIINNPNKYIPNENRLKYSVENIIKKWENEFNYIKIES